jgi:penicillin amidase
MQEASMNLPRLLVRLLLGRRLPRTNGRLRVPGARSALRIHRDRWGIPYVAADNDHDAHFGVGFCHGQDRAFQLEVLLRVIRGTLAEAFGPAALPIDRLARRIGFHHASLEQFGVLDADVRAMLEAYSAGINAGTTLGLPSRPHEFSLLRFRPTPWTPADSLGVVKLISFTLSSNWDAELARFVILTEDGPEALAALDPSSPAGQPQAPVPGPGMSASFDRLSEDLALLTGMAGLGGASNNWAVAGARTATGRPLLANDPHLDARLPTHWYLVQVRTPAWAAAGATFLGGPTVLSGHNGHAAFGMTAGLIDNTDLFREEIGLDGQSFREGDGWVPCAAREEVIHVRGASPVTERVLVTPRGPIISPALEGAQGEALSLRALWLEPRPMRGLLCLQFARDLDEFRRIAEAWPACSQHYVYADVSGTIGSQVIGRAPRRHRGWGTLPLPGWDPAVGWEPDLVPFEAMPHGANPPEGFVATANTDPQPSGDGPFLGVDWIDSYRLAAIRRALAGRTDWDVPRTQVLQTSQESLVWPELREVVLAAGSTDPVAQEAQALLRDWDGRVTVDSPAAAVFELFVAEMAQRVAKAKAPRAYRWALGCGGSLITDHGFFCFRRVSHLVQLLRIQPSGWLGLPWPEEIADALAVTVRGLRGAHGTNPSTWAWGRVRPLVMHHPLGRGRLLAAIFNRGPVPCGGDTDTINQASVFPLRPTEPCNNIASMRAVIDVGGWENSRFVLPGGQSGNPFSPHYDDLFPLWQRGEGVPIAWEPEAVRKAAVETLELVPE